MGVDRDSLRAKYKEALDKYLPPEYSEVVYHRQQRRQAELEESTIRREEREANPQGLRQGRGVPEDPDRDGEAAHGVRRADPVCDVSR